MSSFPCLARFVSGSGQVRYRLGDGLVDRYLEFVAGRCRPNTLRAVATASGGVHGFPAEMTSFVGREEPVRSDLPTGQAM